MPTYLSDTSPEAERVLDDLWRKTTPQERMQMVAEMIEAVRSLALAGLRARHPDASEARIRRALSDILLGSDLAEKAYGPWKEGERLE